MGRFESFWFCDDIRDHTEAIEDGFLDTHGMCAAFTLSLPAENPNRPVHTADPFQVFDLKLPLMIELTVNLLDNMHAEYELSPLSLVLPFHIEFAKKLRILLFAVFDDVPAVD